MKRPLIPFVALALILCASTASAQGRLSPQGGTITNVGAGSGMTGGGAAGPVTLNMIAATGGGLAVTADDVGLLRTCSATQVLAWNGTAWACGTGVGGAIIGTTNTLAKFTGTNTVGDAGGITQTTSGTLIIAGTSGTSSLTIASTDANGIQATRTATAGTVSDKAPVYVTSSGTHNTTAGEIYNYGVRGRADATRSSGANNLNNWGVYGVALGAQSNFGAMGWTVGAGTDDAGVLGLSDSTGTAAYGIRGNARGAATTNYGVFGTATSGGTNYSGYFDAGLFRVQGAATFATTLSVLGGAAIGDASGDAHSLTGTLNANGTAGTNGQIMQVSGGVPVWGAASTAGITTGTGTDGYLTRWTGATSLGNSIVRESGASLGLNAAADLNHQLTFQSVVGNKIALYPDTSTTAYGFGIQGGQLQIYVPNAGSKVSLGYGDSDAFTESVAVSGAVTQVKNAFQADANSTLGDATTDTVYAPGYIGIGAAPISTIQLYVNGGARIYGIYGQQSAAGSTQNSIGIYGEAIGSFNTTGSALESWGAQFANTATRSAGANLLYAYGAQADSSGGQISKGGRFRAFGSGTENWGVEATSFGTGTNYGVYAFAGAATGGDSYAVSGAATATHTGTNNFAIYANASGETNNYSFFGAAGNIYNVGNTTLGDSTSVDSHTINGATTVASTSTTNALSSTYSGTAQTAARVGVLGQNSGTYNTTAGSLFSYGVYGVSTATESAGGNTLFNVGLYGSASGGDDNLALFTNLGRVEFGGAVQADSTLSVIDGATLGNNTADSHVINGATTFTETIGAGGLGLAAYNLYLSDDTTQAIGTGAGITFAGAYTGTTVTGGASIKLYKANGTAGNFDFDLVFGGRANGGGDTAEAFRVVGATAGVTVTGPLVTKGTTSLGDAEADTITFNGDVASNVSFKGSAVSISCGSGGSVTGNNSDGIITYGDASLAACGGCRVTFASPNFTTNAPICVLTPLGSTAHTVSPRICASATGTLDVQGDSTKSANYHCFGRH